VASYCEQLLKGTNLVLPGVASWANPVWHLYVVQSTERPRVQEALEAANISYGIHYPIPVHLQEAYRELGHREGSFPVSEMLAQRILSLPMFPEITEGEVERVAAVLQAL
jgi:dTDP-4-amino-4,6-dideoxygalactose transaminase